MLFRTSFAHIPVTYLIGIFNNFNGRYLFAFNIKNNFVGVLIDFISIPVTVGFTSATSVIIVASQLKGLLGLKISPQGFLDTSIKVFQNIGDTSPWDAGMSISCITILLLFRVMNESLYLFDIRVVSDASF